LRFGMLSSLTIMRAISGYPRSDLMDTP